MKKYRTAQKERKKKVRLKYPLQPLDAYDKHGFASLLGDARRAIADEKTRLDNYDYIFKNLFRFDYSDEEIAELKRNKRETEQRIKEAQESIDAHEAWVEFLMTWEEALDFLRKLVDKGQAFVSERYSDTGQNERVTVFLAEGRFEKDLLTRAIKSVAPVVNYEPYLRDVEGYGEFWFFEAILLDEINKWLDIENWGKD